MKKNFGLLFLLLGVVFASFGQTSVSVKDTITKRYQSGIKYPSPRVADQAAGVKYLVDWTNTRLNSKADTAAVSSRVPHATSTALRLGLVGYPDAVILYDKQGYTFRRDITNSMPDDSAMVIRLGSTIRYVRVTNHLEPEFWGGRADGVQFTGAGTDNARALQKSWDWAKLSGLRVKLGIGIYKYTKALKFEQSGSFSNPGMVMEGAGLYATKLMPAGIVGSSIILDGNKTLVAGNHAHGFQFRDFSIVRDHTSGALTHGLEIRAIYNSVFENLGIESQVGDGFRIIGTMYGDVGANELIDFRNIYIKFCGGWGIYAKGEVSTSVPLAVATFDKVVVNGNIKGVYMEGVQQVEWRYGGIMTNQAKNLVMGYNGTPCSLIKFISTEIGNLTYRIPMVEIGPVQNVLFDDYRFINNPDEVATEGVKVGYGISEKYIKGLTFRKPWIVQASDTLTTYKWFNISDSVSTSSNIRLEEVDYRIFAAGTKIAGMSRVNYYSVEGRTIRRAGTNEVLASNNLTSYTPDFSAGRHHILSYTANTATSIALPSSTNPPVSGDRIVFLIRNNGGRATLTFATGYEVTDATTTTALYSSRTISFIFSALTSSWYQEQASKPAPDTNYLTNPSTITPKPGDFYRAMYNTTTSTTIANPTVSGEYQDGDSFSIALWNTGGPSVSVTFTLGNAYNSPGTIEFPTVAYQGYILRFEYLGGYWWRVK